MGQIGRKREEGEVSARAGEKERSPFDEMKGIKRETNKQRGLEIKIEKNVFASRIHTKHAHYSLDRILDTM